MATRMATRASRAQAVVDAPKSKPKAASRTRHQQRELDRADQQPPDIHAQKSAASLEADSNTFVVGEPDDRYTSHTAETYVNNIVTKLPSQRRSAGLEDLDTIPAFYAARTQPTVHVATPGVSHSLTQSATALLSYLATGTTLTMLSSHIGDQVWHSSRCIECASFLCPGKDIQLHAENFRQSSPSFVVLAGRKVPVLQVLFYLCLPMCAGRT